MSNVHASADARDCGAIDSARTPFHAIETLRLAAEDLARRLVANARHRRTMKRIAHFSDHRLQDIGFERDWDGSILPSQREPGQH